MPVLREKLQARIDQQYGHHDRRVFVSSGTSGGIVLTLLSLVNPGDEVIIFDPYFVMYEALTRLVGGTPVLIPTYPDFRIPLDRVADAITDRTKMILLNSPANPTGRGGHGGGDPWIGGIGQATRYRPGVGRDLQRVLLRRAVRVTGASSTSGRS